jgi:hypothetical protein
VIADVSASFYQCDSVQPSAGFDTILTTFVGETADHDWSAMYYTPTAAGVSGSQAPFAVPSNAAPSNTVSEITATSLLSQTPTTTSTSKLTPIGAIVGGAVGGIAIIGAVIAGIVFMVLRNRKRTQINDQSPSYNPSQGQLPVMHQQQYVPPPPDNRPMSYFPTQELSKTPIIETNSSPYTTNTQPFFNQNSPDYQQQQAQQPPNQHLMGTPQNPVEIGGTTHPVPMHNHEGHAVYEAQG